MQSRILVKGTKKARRGMVGIEAAIVLIAFVIVAAALAFVVLNMGFFTTQKSKEAMSSGLKEASTALEVDGSVLGNVSGSKVIAVAIPLKTSSGKNPVDLTRVAVTAKTPDTVEVYSKSDIAIIVAKDSTAEVYYYDSNNGWTTLTNANVAILDNPFDTFVNVSKALENVTSPKVLFIEYQGDGDTLLEVNEKWVAVVNTTSLNLDAYTTFVIEIKPAVGAPLTVERMVPPQLSDQIISLE